ncbi:hypothetical protein FPY71_10175 [Aureimonas fodinaquatilis]|uniref:Uncharacterized protein n=1 Tax=Aureimonas fodinaquatilis TaxID=2565783 RepID=A0A5B0DWJ5_9HYPH|nr:hypothetical protein [Aureimonas fodinaquatilis]KAA0970833.1 hypothetical protein FPY71_10175 [Aureimonas fodinaquatilis]
MARSAAAFNDSPGIGHNSGLSPDQRHALALMHRRKFKEIDAREKLIKAEKRNLGKVVKVDLGDTGMLQIKTMIRAETEEGREALEAELRATAEAKSWASGEDGQLDMFSGQPKPDETRAFHEGKIAGMDDEPLRNPYGAGTVDHEDYARGWQRGHQVMEEIHEMKAEQEDSLIEGPGHDDGGDLDEGDEE